ncbi:hypothetical protein [Rhodococcus sp. ACT016]|uniref:hypothetical protein n=1 Tax=Rhodococcus sp. ACT016 TaxID=3134808 RepID=UPI003D2D1BF9
MTYTPPPPNYYPPQQWPPPQPPKKKNNVLPSIFAAIGVITVLFIILGACDDSGGSNSSASSRTRISPDSATTVERAPKQSVAGPRETLTFEGGLTATVSSVTTGTSTNRFDHDGPITVIQFELRNAGTKTFDAADWWAPYLNYGPRGLIAEEISVAGTVNGIKPDLWKGSGLIPPGGVVTVSSAYGVTLPEMSPATITPRWEGRLLWSGDFAAEFSTP